MNTSNNTHLQKSPSLAEVQLKYKSHKSIESYPLVSSPQQAVAVLREIWNEDTIELKEEFAVLLLNNSKKCLGWSKVSSGGKTSSIVDPSLVFQVALLGNATSIILSHNHPSGNTDISKADKDLTNRIAESGKMLGIAVEDHIILTANEYVSFRAKGII